MAAIVTSAQQAVDNINSFNESIDDMVERLSQARAWYAVKVGGKWRFGPSKFIGYRGMTAREYLKEARKELDGRVTEAALAEWFVPVDPTSDLYKDLSAQLHDLVGRFGRRPSRLARISVLRSEAGHVQREEKNDELVRLLAAAYRRLTSHEREIFRRLTT